MGGKLVLTIACKCMNLERRVSISILSVHDGEACDSTYGTMALLSFFISLCVNSVLLSN